jgi:hypothetical protein
VLALVPAPRPAPAVVPVTAVRHRVDLRHRPRRSPVVELGAHRALRDRRERALREAAAAPVRYVPAAFVDALQGAWGAVPVVEREA